MARGDDETPLQDGQDGRRRRMMKQVWTRQRPVWRLVREGTTVMVLCILVWGGALCIPRVLILRTRGQRTDFCSDMRECRIATTNRVVVRPRR